MPSGIYFRSKEHKKAFLNRMRGKKYHLGFKNSIESRNKMSEVRKKGLAEGKITIWNKGKKGIQKQSNKQKIMNSINLKEQYRTGKRKVNIKSIQALINYHKYKKHSIEVINKIKIARAKQIFPRQDTSIELKIQNYLKELGITFFTHQYIKEINHAYQCDILIPSMNLVIECDGDYWHKYPIGNEIDHIRTSELLEKGFKVLRLWEHEIKVMDLNKFKEKILI